MFGFTIIRKSELAELRSAYYLKERVARCHRWFAGWKDLDVIWDLLMNYSRSVEVGRKQYARARGTDEYGEPLEKDPLQYQVTECMEFIIWLNGFERTALHWTVWERMRELLERLAKSGASS